MRAITQVLVLLDEELSQEVGPALWAALIEVERFYNRDVRRAEFRRYYMSPVVPTTSIFGSAWQGLGRFLTKSQTENSLDLMKPKEKIRKGIKAAPSRYANTYDQRRLADAVLKDLSTRAHVDSNVLIVTDCEITPPPEWRYIIWETLKQASVLSMAPLDPLYWNYADPARVNTIKNRTRAAALSITGEMLGFRRCDNPECYLFDDIDSAARLDVMNQLGREHSIPGLSGQGFPLDEQMNAAEIQSSVESVPTA